MGLEDHPGDIIAKAIQLYNIPLDTVVKKARIMETELASFMQSGNPPVDFDVEGLCKILGLSAKKFLSIINGWQPMPVDLGKWRHLKQITTGQYGFFVHNYLVWDEHSKETAVFDTGLDAEPTIKLIEENQLNPLYLFITHGHSDHCSGVRKFIKLFPNMTIVWNRDITIRNPDKEIFAVGNLTVRAAPVYGHSQDAVVYTVGGWEPKRTPPIVVVGDAIFAGSIGRVVNQPMALKNIFNAVLTLPPDTLICPGHGPLTTVNEELTHNPFFDL